MATLLKIARSQKRTWVNGFKIFSMYCALKGHFSGTFDVKKYGLKTSVSHKSYDRRSDKVFFERLAKKLTLGECYQMIVSNFAANANMLSYELAGSDSYDFYLEHSGYLDVFSQHYKSELYTVFGLLNKDGKNMKDLFNATGHPPIMQLVMQGVISVETFLVLNRLLNFVPVIDKNIGDDLVWHNFKIRVMAYDTLLLIDKDLAKKVFIETKRAIQ